MDADSFKKLYPELYLTTFTEKGVRPDGRTLGKGRALTVGPGAVNAAQGSALVKLGDTSVLAGARASLVKPADGTADEGSLAMDVQFAPFATPQGGGLLGPRGPTAELVSAVSERLHACLRPLSLPKQLCIKPGAGAYAVQLDIYVLNADGAVFDAVLLAALATLRDLALPPSKETKKGEEGGAAGEASGSVRAMTEEEAASSGTPPVRLHLSVQPLAVTCCMYKEYLLVDPTAEEEAVAGSTVTIVLDASSALHGVYKSGGSSAASPMDLTRCIESAKLRYKELAGLLEQALQEGEE